MYYWPLPPLLSSRPGATVQVSEQCNFHYHNHGKVYQLCCWWLVLYTTQTQCCVCAQWNKESLKCQLADGSGFSMTSTESTKHITGTRTWTCIDLLFHKAVCRNGVFLIALFWLDVCSILITLTLINAYTFYCLCSVYYWQLQWFKYYSRNNILNVQIQVQNLVHLSRPLEERERERRVSIRQCRFPFHWILVHLPHHYHLLYFLIVIITLQGVCVCFVSVFSQTVTILSTNVNNYRLFTLILNSSKMSIIFL